MTGRLIDHGQPCTSAPHRITYFAQINIGYRIVFTIDKQYGLAQCPTGWSGMGIVDIYGIIQIPGITGAETSFAESSNEDVKISRGPDRGVRLGRRSFMRCTIPATVGAAHKAPATQ